jgi:23S rRNA (cytosine1962-C5)-methyltransferase
VFRDFKLQVSPGTLVVLEAAGEGVIGWGLADEGPIAVRVLGRGAPPDAPFAEVLAERIRRADAVRPRLIEPDTDCWRAIAGEGDGLPGLIVDRYADVAVVRLYAAGWEPHLDTIVEAVRRLPWCITVFRRLGVERVDGSEGGLTLAGPEAPQRLVVREHGMRLLVRPWEGQKTGLFLDQREHRALVRRWAQGRMTVNLFGYTGGFSVAAALGGAPRVVTVDIAPAAIEDARENFRLNGIPLDAHAFEVADAFAWTSRAPVGLLIADPPSLTHDRKADRAAERAYRKLHAHLGPQVARDGLLVTASCTARLPLDAWRGAVAEGLAASGDWSWHWQSAEPPDHPCALAHDEGRYLKLALLRRRSL